jgi:mRNA interferase RelE/StbE
MGYDVDYSQQAIKELKKLDKHIRKQIIAWIDTNLVGIKNPRLIGKALSANHKGKWRYRVGDYRLLVEIQEARLVIFLLEVGHRKEIY